MAKATIKRRDGVVQTDIAEHATLAVIQAMVDGYRSAGGGRIWLCRATLTKSYDVEATKFAAAEFSKLMKSHGLEIIIAVISSAAVRMGARVVALMAKFDLRIVANDEEAEALLRPLLAATGPPDKVDKVDKVKSG